MNKNQPDISTPMPTMSWSQNLLENFLSLWLGWLTQLCVTLNINSTRMVNNTPHTTPDIRPDTMSDPWVRYVLGDTC